MSNKQEWLMNCGPTIESGNLVPGHNVLHVDVLFKSKYIYWVEFNLLGKNGIYRARPNGMSLHQLVPYRYCSCAC